MTLGLSCVFCPLSARGPPTGTCSSGCPGAQESTLVARVIGEEAAAGVVRSPNPVGVLASAWPGGAGIGGEGLQWWVFPLGITQQRCSPSLVVQASSTSIPVCRAPPSLLSPQDVSSQPAAVLCLGLLSNPHVPAPSPCVQWWTPLSGLGSRAVVSTICRGLTLGRTGLQVVQGQDVPESPTPGPLPLLQEGLDRPSGPGLALPRYLPAQLTALGTTTPMSLRGVGAL